MIFYCFFFLLRKMIFSYIFFKKILKKNDILLRKQKYLHQINVYIFVRKKGKKRGEEEEASLDNLTFVKIYRPI